MWYELCVLFFFTRLLHMKSKSKSRTHWFLNYHLKCVSLALIVVCLSSRCSCCCRSDLFSLLSCVCLCACLVKMLFCIVWICKIQVASTKIANGWREQQWIKKQNFKKAILFNELHTQFNSFAFFSLWFIFFFNCWCCLCRCCCYYNSLSVSCCGYTRYNSVRLSLFRTPDQTIAYEQLYMPHCTLWHWCVCVWLTLPKKPTNTKREQSTTIPIDWRYSHHNQVIHSAHARIHMYGTHTYAHQVRRVHCHNRSTDENDERYVHTYWSQPTNCSPVHMRPKEMQSAKWEERKQQPILFVAQIHSIFYLFSAML